MALSPGTTVGAYEIVALIGAGGMGEVYRARDRKLDRDVAIKVLPEAFVSDPERLARFQREAKTLAALNHPNIGAIYGIEESNGFAALVLELVEGPTLADRIAQGPLPLDEALPIARQIVEALEAAHEQHIIHRDLKPANIKVQHRGTVKVLDFGLAKALARETDTASGRSLTNSPTMTSPVGMTAIGMLLGTAAYMAPEQAKGKPADKRSDLWAFGCVLYELLTGTSAFAAEDVTDTLAAVLRSEPDWRALPAATPTSIRRLLRRCLEKDRKRRLADAADARLEIDAAHDEGVPADTRSGAQAPQRWMALAGWLVAALMATGSGFLYFTDPSPAPSPRVRFEIGPPEKTTLATGGMISPDGTLVAFGVRNAGGLMTIWVRSLDSLEARPLTRTEDNIGLTFFWSPDSRFIGYAAANRTLKKVDVSSGTPETLTALDGFFRGGDWNRDGVVIFAVDNGLRQVSESGGAASVLTTVVDRTSYVEPVFLPDGRHFLYTRLAAEREDSGVYVGTIEAGSEKTDPQRLLRAGTRAVFAPSEDPNTGRLLFVRGATLMAQPFDAARLQLRGEPVTIAEDVSDLNARTFSVSNTGVLAFRSATASVGSRLIWFDRGGKPLGAVGPPALYGDVAMAPDGKTVVVSRRETTTEMPRLWAIDLPRQVPSRINPESQWDSAPAVSDDGRVAFSSGVSGDLYVRAVSGAGESELLLKSAHVKHANDWSADGRFLIYDDHHPTARQDLWVLPLNGDRKPIPFLTTAADESLGQFSPDNRWIVYQSDESGRREIYVRDFAPDRVPALGSARIAISTAGGRQPRWRPDGTEIYYISLDAKLMAVPIKTRPTFEAYIAAPLFDVNVAGTYSYEVTRDGRFLVNTIAEEDSSSPITIVTNWQTAMTK